MDLGVCGVRMSYRMCGVALWRFPELKLWNLVFGMWMSCKKSGFSFAGGSLLRKKVM